MSKVAVIGAGSWGTALSIVLANNGRPVSLYARRDEQVFEINEYRTNSKYLPGVHLPPGIIASSCYSQVLHKAEYVLLVLPTGSIRHSLREMQSIWEHRPLIIHSSKGLEQSSYKRISQMIEEEVPSEKRRGIIALSGPSHAEEVGRLFPTTVVAAGSDLKQAEEVRDLFINPHFRVYTNADLVGVELGGALKNIIALGTGLSDGLGYGDNAKAALITRGLAEITRLGVKLGANEHTFFGLTGVGDLIVTCTSQHSRNWRCGYALGQGDPLNKVLSEMGMVVEGVQTTKAAYHLSRELQVEMPITCELYQVLFQGKEAHQAVNDLMQRGPRAE